MSSGRALASHARIKLRLVAIGKRRVQGSLRLRFALLVLAKYGGRETKTFN